MKYEMWSDGAPSIGFSAIDDGHAVVRGYGLAAGTEDTLYAVADGMRGRPLAVYRIDGRYGERRVDIPGIASMSQKDLDVINGSSTLRRRLVEEIVGHGVILESEYATDDRMAMQHILYKGKVFSFTVACGNRQFEKADPKDVHRLGIPQNLRRLVP